MLKKHNDKLNDESYSIGISKHVPNNSVNLAFLAAPEITEDNISIVRESVGIDIKEEYNERKDLHYAKNDSNLVTTAANQDILITDEFSIKKYADETPEPLFYKATLKNTMSGDRFLTNNKFVPYQYGYSLRTEDVIKAENTSNDKSDITPLIYRETYENGYNNIVNITTGDGNKVLSGFKIRMVKQVDNTYSVEIYNNFDKDKIYRVTYINSNGDAVTEVLESNLLFTKISYDEFTSKLGQPEYWMATEYAIKQEGKNFEVYAPTQMMNITDENRKPFEFKYRVFANLQGNYSKSAPVQIKVGLVFLNGGALEDIHASMIAFDQSIGGLFPDYVSFINPHPPLQYASQNADYKKSPDYWDIDITAPQDYINDYDIIFISGYGVHDLSAFNDKFASYLNAGGKIVIDNLSNTDLEMLNVGFGSSNPIVNYSMTAPIQSGNREFGPIAKYRSRHYDLSNDPINHIAYIYDDNGEVMISPQLTLNSEDANVWEDIIRYSSGQRSIAIKTYNKRGKIIVSNCGILKAFSLGTYIEAKKFMVNLAISLVEDIWRVTPWIYNRVYHKNQLYKHEYQLEHYITDINPLGGSQIIAKKILADKVKDHVSYYTGLYGLEGSYYVEAYERNLQGEFISLSNIYMPASRTEDSAMNGNIPLYVFARSTTNTNFNVASVEGYEDSNIYPYSAPVTFNVTITPFTFRWTNKDGNIEQEIVEPGYSNRTKIPFTINKEDGSVNLGLLSTLLPSMPSGADWTDKSNVFFRVEISASDDVEGKFVNPKENRINLYIYDKFSGEYLYSSDSDNIIPYSLLYEWRSIERRDRGGDVLRQRYNDIVLQASTNHYELVASKRVYAVVSNATNDNSIMLPISLNTNESWFPRIRYMRFTKTSFNKEDYDRISKTIGFRFDKDEIIAKAEEYFGTDPVDDKVADIISKLSGDSTVDVNDIAILSEAFDIMSEETVCDYDMQEYFRQPWEEYPYKSVRDEYAQYLNINTIKVQHTPMNIVRGKQTGEALQQVTPTIYKSLYENWIASLPITIQMETEVSGVWETIFDGFVIDYANGRIIFNESPARSIRASYNYSNLKIIKKTYMNAKATLEELTKLQERMYIGKAMLNKRILRAPNPQITIKYTDGSQKLLAPGSYNIDYDTGIVTTSEAHTGQVYMTYSYANVEYIGVKDYDMAHGVIELERSIHFNDNIYVSYSYREDYYEYKGYFDKDYIDPVTGIQGKFIYVDLNPTRGHECTYPIVNSTSISYKEIPTYSLIGKTLYLYMLPSRIVRGSFIKEEDTTIRHTFSIDDLKLLQIAHPELIVLGSIKLMNNYTVYDVTSLDTRVRGGGLNENITDSKIEKTDELSLNLWDIAPFDGRSYHPNGISIIKVPKTVLIENGGKFSSDEVEEIVKTHLALGVMPIVKYY